VTDDLSGSARIVAMEEGVIHLDAGSGTNSVVAALETEGPTDAWISDVGPGDRVEIERTVHRTDF
jgi:hypothetical protein